MDGDVRARAAGWRRAIERADVRAGLEAVYARASSEIAARGPACWASGRCCNFDRAGHRLYVTGLEAAYTIMRLPEIAAEGQRQRAVASEQGWTVSAFGEARLGLRVLEDAKQRGGCPFQVRNLCGVHAIKPLGCRVYFCDQSAQDWQQDLSERLITEIKQLHDAFGVEYRYGEWRGMLADVEGG
jgi:Fe-S-cluster containining protein